MEIKIMKTLLTTLYFCLLSAILVAQNANPNYDSTLAKKLGSDDYGMKSYILVILKTGTNTTATKTEIDSCFRSHMNNINAMVKSGELIVAGPMGKNDHSYRGIFILNVTSIEKAKELLKADAAVNYQILEAEYFNWYGSAALPEYLESSDKIWKVQP